MTKKGAMAKLLEKIEDYYERNEHLFLNSCGAVEATEQEEKELEFLISSLDENGPTRTVHMPGYPE